MIFLGEDRLGCFAAHTIGLEESKGAMLDFYNIDGKSSSIPKRKRDGLLVVSISTTESEAVSRMTCFNDKIYTYAFGSKPGNIQVRILAFLGHSAPNKYTREVEAGDTLKRMLNIYQQARVSQSLRAVKVSFPGEGPTLQGELDGMTTGTRDPNSGIQEITLNLTTTEPQGKL